MSATKVFGHRGWMGSFPENTLLGFKEAINAGVDGLELDVHMTKDGEIVVIHDDALDRTTDGTGLIRDLTLAEIKKYSAGINYSTFPNYDGNQWIAERVPTLQEVLEFLAPYDTELNIELKTFMYPYKGMEAKVLSVVEQYGNGRKVIYSSFHLPSILKIKALNSSAKIAWILNQCIPQPKDYLETLQLEALHLYKGVLLIHAHQYKDIVEQLRVWTANENDEIKQLLDLNVNTIITDHPEKALFFRSERNSFV
ncbi:glycerophosphodiester phosphodiesterase [Oceanobacillus saliphilus]|uniref:glycerophosphodiester phosphodiesterase n=1 Tax=Oceanobacillus saliphilus TaxID=2925834 RepID=UPI00201D910B|nr:glycerophosphodiester phosphodiesterase [Oceanobacillus saliphilus]